MSKLQWKFTIQPVIDGVETKHKYGMVIDDTYDETDMDDKLEQFNELIRQSVKFYRNRHTD